MLSFPVYLLIEQQIKSFIENKVIAEIKCETYYKECYSWHGESFHNLVSIKTQR